MNEKEIVAMEKQKPLKPRYGHHCPRCGDGLPTKSVTDPYFTEFYELLEKGEKR